MAVTRTYIELKNPKARAIIEKALEDKERAFKTGNLSIDEVKRRIKASKKK